jgi:hypothetical protein
MLFKVMKSYATYKGTYQFHSTALSGPVVLFVIVMGGGFYFYQHPPAECLFTEQELFLRLFGNFVQFQLFQKCVKANQNDRGLFRRLLINKPTKDLILNMIRH